MAVCSSDCTSSTFVFYDQYDESDKLHAKCLAEQLPIAPIKLPFMGHATARLYNTKERLQFVVDSALAGDVNALKRFGARLRHENGDRAWLVALHLADAKPLIALRVAEAWWDRWPAAQKPHVAFRLAGSGHADAVLGLMEKLAAECPEDAEVQGCTALVALEADKPSVHCPMHHRPRVCYLIA